MAIVSDYGTLKAEMTLDLFHPRLINRYDSAIDRFERAANSRLRVRQQETAVFLTVDVGGTVHLPTDYLLWRAVRWADAVPHYIELDYIDASFMNTSNHSLYGNPNVFMIRGAFLNVKPLQTIPATVQLLYYQKIPTIIATPPDIAATNWLLTEYPNAYIYGVMCELAGMMRNLEMAQLYKARRDETFAEIIQLSALSTGATSPQLRTAEYF